MANECRFFASSLKGTVLVSLFVKFIKFIFPHLLQRAERRVHYDFNLNRSEKPLPRNGCYCPPANPVIKYCLSNIAVALVESGKIIPTDHPYAGHITNRENQRTSKGWTLAPNDHRRRRFAHVRWPATCPSLGWAASGSRVMVYPNRWPYRRMCHASSFLP